MNKLERFAYQYYGFCNNFYKTISKDGYTVEKPELEKRLFGHYVSKTYIFYLKNVENHVEFSKIYQDIMTDIESKWMFSYPKVIKDFVHFMKACEKTFFYNNDDGNSVYGEIDSVSNTYRLHINADDCNILYEVQDSSIELPVGDYLLSKNNPLSFMNDDNSDTQKTVLFANVSVKRNYGENMFNEYKFIDGSPIVFENPGDEILFDIIDKIVKKFISDTFNDILDNSICKMSDLNGKISAEEVLNNGTMGVWRLRSR